MRHRLEEARDGLVGVVDLAEDAASEVVCGPGRVRYRRDGTLDTGFAGDGVETYFAQFSGRIRSPFHRPLLMYSKPKRPKSRAVLQH